MPEAIPNDTRPAFRWTGKKERAAELVAEEELTYDEIAHALGVGTATVRRWAAHADFRARVKRRSEEIGDAATRYAIARRLRRIKGYDDRRERMLRLIAERAAAHTDAPGGSTGLLVRTVKVVGGGENAERVEEYELDAALLRELRELEKQAAIEAGQWQEAASAEGLHAAGVVVLLAPAAGGRAPDRAKVLGLEHRPVNGVEGGGP